MDQNHAITIDPVHMMMMEMHDSPKILCKFDGKESCCIFKVPESLLEINKEAYEPRIVSIGPYHHGKDLQMIKELKWRYLYDFLEKMPQETTVKSVKSLLKSLLNTMKSIESEIRQSYSESIEHISSNDLAKMMVLDGVFLIELFRKFGKMNQNDPIFKMVWVLPFLMRDFLRIENQIPFFVLQELFNGSQTKTDNRTLPSLILKFFNYAADRPKVVLSNYADLQGKHLLDFFRKSFMKKPDVSIGNGTPGHVVDRPSQELTSEDACFNETVALTGNETSHGDTSIECIQPTKTHLTETVSLTRNETSHDDTSIERIQPGKMHLKETFGLTGNETSDDDASTECIQPVKMLFIETSASTGNEMSYNDNPDVRRYSEEMEDDELICVGTAPVGTLMSYSPSNEHIQPATNKTSDNPSDDQIQPATNKTSDNPSDDQIQPATNKTSDNTSVERIQPATKLVVAGVKFKKNQDAESFLDIKFQNGVLLIPGINLDDFYTCFILNGMIFEQCYSDCTKDITTYIVFLGCLINTSMDVGLLSEKKIIQNYLGTDKELVKFFNNVGKYVAFNIKDNYLKSVFKEINEYCDSGWYVAWAGFKHTYFDSPWTFISAFAAFVLLCLAGIQTLYTVYPYYYEHN